MLTLINSNRMTPPIGPLGLEYIAGAAAEVGIDVDVLDLCMTYGGEDALAGYFATRQPDLVGISFRNVDDCFWPSGQWFVPDLARTVRTVRTLTDVPIVLGGVGLSIFPRRIFKYTGADFVIHGDGESAIIALYTEVHGGRRRFDRVDGLIWRDEDGLHVNPPAWPEDLSLPPARDAIDNASYFKLGGQAGVETKRGCDRECIYCADPLAKGTRLRVRPPSEVADEFESLLAQGVDVLHLCDGEFNIPVDHAMAVCDELIDRGLGDRVQWYTYMAVVPFDDALADAMCRAGCVGINFTSDAAAESMLRTYRHAHRREHVAEAVRLCRRRGIAVMLDLMLGGPGETPETLADTLDFVQRIDPDCAGAALGIRVYPGTPIAEIIAAQGPIDINPGLRRKYEGQINFFKPTFYISPALGDGPAKLVRELIGDDKRFFPPAIEGDLSAGGESGDHNYNDNTALVEAITAGARGAYWDILRQL